jgi:RNA polymerase subunit RPABC4/transcription elongation factor Spt4
MESRPWQCGGCGERYRVHLFTCPRCHGHDVTKEEAVALQVCANCTTKCAGDLTSCPHCKSTDLKEDGTMPKITRHGGPSYAADIPDEHDHAEPEVDEPELPLGESEESEAEGDVVDNDVEPDAEPAAATTPRPATSASKAEWLAYAREVTGDTIDGDDYTKTELQDLTKPDEG